jgi:hypothetical protein
MLRRVFRRRGSNDEGSLQDEPGLEKSAAAKIDDEEAGVPSAYKIVVRWRFASGLALVVLAVLFFVADLGASIPEDLVRRWPWLLVIIGVLGLLAGVITAWPYGTLGGPLIAIVGVMVLIRDQDIAANMMTAAGAALIAFGMGILLRGLTAPRT